MPALDRVAALKRAAFVRLPLDTAQLLVELVDELDLAELAAIELEAVADARRRVAAIADQLAARARPPLAR
jgi:hypothetical protein